MFNILSQITLKVKFLGNEVQHCLLPSLVDDFTRVHLRNALLTHTLSTLFSSTSVLFSCTPFGTKSYIWKRFKMITLQWSLQSTVQELGPQASISTNKKSHWNAKIYTTPQHDTVLLLKPISLAATISR